MMLQYENNITGVNELYDMRYKELQDNCDMPHRTYMSKQETIRITADIELCAKCSKKL